MYFQQLQRYIKNTKHTQNSTIGEKATTTTTATTATKPTATICNFNEMPQESTNQIHVPSARFSSIFSCTRARPPAHVIYVITIAIDSTGTGRFDCHYIALSTARLPSLPLNRFILFLLPALSYTSYSILLRKTKWNDWQKNEGKKSFCILLSPCTSFLIIFFSLRGKTQFASIFISSLLKSV